MHTAAGTVRVHHDACILRGPTALSDGAVLTELELAPTLLMRNQVEWLLVRGNASSIGSSSKMMHGDMVDMNYHRLLKEEIFSACKK